MPTQKPLPVLLPNRLRQMPPSFAWVDHRLRSSGLLPMLEPAELGLYLFLSLAADNQGLSCWRLDRIEAEMPCFDRNSLWKARDRLLALDLIAFKQWRSSAPDGVYQVLSIQRSGTALHPELNIALATLNNNLRHE